MYYSCSDGIYFSPVIHFLECTQEHFFSFPFPLPIMFIQEITKVGDELGIVPVVIKGEELDQKGFGGTVRLMLNFTKETILTVRALFNECCRTKTKVITTANQNKDKFYKEPIELKVNSCKWS